MQRMEVSCAVRPMYGSLGAKGLRKVKLGAYSDMTSKCYENVSFISDLWEDMYSYIQKCTGHTTYSETCSSNLQTQS
jgi:hypothetical protein